MALQYHYVSYVLLYSCLPPDFSISFVSLIIISWLRDLHISYTVSAAIVAPTRASISTPVFDVMLAVQSITKLLLSDLDINGTIVKAQRMA